MQSKRRLRFAQAKEIIQKEALKVLLERPNQPIPEHLAQYRKIPGPKAGMSAEKCSASRTSFINKLRRLALSKTSKPSTENKPKPHRVRRLIRQKRRDLRSRLINVGARPS